MLLFYFILFSNHIDSNTQIFEFINLVLSIDIHFINYYF